MKGEYNLAKKRVYDENSIKILETDREKVRKRPTIYIPSKDEKGAMHIIFEIIDNSIDELTVAGSVGDTVTITYDKVTKVVTVADNGSGIPQARLLDVCTKLNSSGKFDNDENSVYEWSGGLNGVGCKTCVYLSEWCEVSSMQKGKSLTYRFEDGLLKDTTEEKSKDHGTVFKFKIDDKLIKISGLDHHELIERCEEKSYLFPKIAISLAIKENGKTKKTYNFTGKTIVDKVESMKPDTDIISGSASEIVEILEHVTDEHLTKKKVLVDFAFGFSEEAVDEETTGEKIISYGNTIKTYTGGQHVQGLRDGVVKYFRNDLQATLNKRDKELPIIPSDIYSGICGFVVAKVHAPDFKGQYKDELMNPEVRTAVRDVVYKTLKDSKPGFQKKMAEFVVRVARGRLESKKARTKGKDVSNSFSKDRIKKYSPIIRTTNTIDPELVLVEGDSAADVANTARDPENQAIYPIQKPKNVFDADSNMDSEIVGVFNNIMAICNLKPGKHCDPSKSEMRRILCMTDGDVDGDRIAVSAIALLAKHCRPIIDAGMVGRIVPPTYRYYEGKKKVFVRDQRDFYHALAKDFVKKFTLKLGNKTYTNKEFGEFIEENFEYNDRLKLLAKRYTCDELFMEYIASKYHGTPETQTQAYWKKALKQYPDLSVLKEEGYLLIDGTIGMEVYHLAIDDNLYKHVMKFKKVQDKNKEIYGYELNGKQCSVYEIMHTFDQHRPSGIKRFKGLGELDEDEMRKLCMDRENRNVVIFKFEDFEDDMYKLDVVMSSHAEFRRARKKIMSEIKLDIMDLDT